MYKSLSEVIEGVHEVSEIFNRLSANSELSFDEKFKLFELFMSLKDTNEFIDMAQREANIAPEQLANTSHEISDAVTQTIAIYNSVESTLLAIDFMADSDNYLKPFNEEIKAKQSQARQLWQEYTSLSNKLDYMDIDSDEFKMLDKQCDATKSEYDEISKEIAKLHDELRHRKSSVAAFAYFDPSLYSLLLTRIGQIANSILLDLAKLNPNIGGKEGDK